ncbi:STAS/SEC14 domain-containing protein [Chryseobacterium terrae]|uniref:STAS/SEC14 domain-containing protein n=1 Tax=Chryseobacterium terrae TaxID=3163299 RepID=A0ABW8Y7D0_9FLAO
MISLLNDAPENVAAFSASGNISLADFDSIIIPHVEKKMKRFNELNYLLYLNNNLPKTDVDVWLSHSLLKLNKISLCNRAAIVSDDFGLQKITALHTNKFKIFSSDNIYGALHWCNNGN